MGYKLSGYEVIGNCEIDAKIAEMYKANHHPQYSYCMDIREFVLYDNSKIPEALFSLDILDGSPPCSVFSVAGKREHDWGRMKHFREGQVAQTLDDLFFEYIKLLGKLKPKVFVAENVKGLVLGKAKGYVHEILNKINAAGYVTQIFCLNSANMGVPQRRERVFFIGHKKELNYPKLSLQFNMPPIKFGDIRTSKGHVASENAAERLKQKIYTDTCMGDICLRLYGKNSGFNNPIVWDDTVAPTITANGSFYRACDDSLFSKDDIINCQTFPYDYDFRDQNVQYVCGMSVPPFMMKLISAEIARQWLKSK